MNAADECSQSPWMDHEVAPGTSPLAGSASCDVVVVGSGIAGLSVAYELAQSARQVIVVDRGRIGGGMTARTTAHLSPVCDNGFHELVSMRGEGPARGFYQSQSAAVERIEQVAGHEEFDCAFRRVDAFLFPDLEADVEEVRKSLDQEYEAARTLGVTVERVVDMPLAGLRTAPSLRYPHQATFHPLRYLAGLARAVAARGGRLFSDTAIIEIAEEKDRVVLATAFGTTITAAHAVIATNSPINNLVEIHSKMAPYRTYAMAFPLAGAAVPDALFWDTADPYHYVRRLSGGDQDDLLIVGGEDHKSGEADDQDERFQRLTSWVRRLVPGIGPETHRWSGQVMETLDFCGYIGRNPHNQRVFVATGDSGQGITHGVVAGMLLRDLILTGASAWEEIYEPGRKTLRAAGTYVRENLTALKGLGEHLTGGDIDSPASLAPSAGGIYRDGAHKLAVCRDRDGILHVHSAACTHLGCVVHWNGFEQCWDCPCHGSHFAADGTVLNGPARTALAKASLPRRD